MRTFRQLRRAGRINEFVSIYVNLQQQAIHIASDGGRICRPLIIVENEASKVKELHMKVRRLLFLPRVLFISISSTLSELWPDVLQLLPLPTSPCRCCATRS